MSPKYMVPMIVNVEQCFTCGHIALPDIEECVFDNLAKQVVVTRSKSQCVTISEVGGENRKYCEDCWFIEAAKSQD